MIRFPSSRRAGRRRGARGGGSALTTLLLAMLLVFLTTLGYLQGRLSVPWANQIEDSAADDDSVAANDWQAPANLPRPTASNPSGAPGETRRSALLGSADALQARFGLCHSGGGTNCVVDGDTFWFAGQKIRIADIDTPETHPPGCAAEARLGKAATRRLHALLNAGPFSLDGGDTDRYGRALRVVTRDGTSLGGVLVDEGLARWYAGGRQPWC